MTKRFGVIAMFFLTTFWCGYAQMRIISHVTSPTGGFTTEIVVDNVSGVDGAYQLQPFNANGDRGTPYAEVVAAGGSFSQPVGDFFPEDMDIAYFTITANENIRVSVNYDFADGQGSPAIVRETDQQATIYRISAGNWDLVFDGIAFVNTGEVNTDVWVAQKDSANNVIQSEMISAELAPMNKDLYVIGSPDGSEFTPMPNTFFEISASQPLAITPLRGTLGREGEPGLLWGTNPLIISQAATKRDEQKVWFVEGGNLYMSYEAMGYNVATDRLWQADLFRRNARGRLSEIFGPDFVSQDSLVRTVGYSDAEYDAYYAELSAETQTMIKAYVDGFNRRVGQVNSNAELVPFEYRALGRVSVAPWTIYDVMAFMAFLQRNFNPDDSSGGT